MNGQPISRYPFERSSVTIVYTLDFEEMEARVYAGLGLVEYDSLPGDPEWCDEMHPVSKSEIIVAHRMHKLIGAVQEHARAKGARRR